MKVGVLRTVLHQLNLTPEQCGRLIGVLPSATSLKAVDLRRQSARVEAFVALYHRCVDICGLLSAEPHGLYGMELLSREQVLIVRVRLGRLRTLDLSRIDMPFWVPEPHVVTGPVRSSTFRERLEETDQDTQQMQHLIHDLRLHDDPTSHGNANRYVLDLSIHEDWIAARVLLMLGAKEPGVHFDEPSWSEKAHLEERGCKWLIPSEWLSELPNVGIFSVRYFVQVPQYRDLVVRGKLAEKYLGW
eukprot:gnl/TRDRNA2_/TRDRNA2_171251_c0_seq1.p1 gnl/TRDRNA2_/TRDRNA2_171251_c0~~gnl/TRDRNA2_/TRDRNA2_171251_c0_seq1.p1  ORF type:complete len:245 (+),score=42.62 gnl/TRDRNA2_/TRDRNA2_171251_c0_seq1:71-805(+)